MNLSVTNIFRGDRVIWIVLMLLSLLSLLVVYSSTGALAYRKASGNTLYYLVRQVFFLAAGFGIMALMVNVFQVRIYAIAANFLVYLSVALLLLTVGLKFAGMLEGSGRTLNLKIISFQPAELAKISLIMYAAKVLGKNQENKQQFKKAFLKVLIHSFIVCGLIFISDFSTSALLFATIMTLMFVARIPMKYLLLVLGSGIAIVVAIYFLADNFPKAPTRVHTVKNRIDRFIKGDPDAKDGITQPDYAKLAIYEGGFFGKGPGHSDVSNYMAAAQNDFIFAIIVEEYGLVVGIVVIFLYLIFFFRSVVVVRRATRTFPAFLVTGLTLILVYQAIINIGVSSGLLPVTGQPLPWVSLGGTSLLFSSISFGCILSVSYQNQINKKIQKPPVQVTGPDEDFEMAK